MNLDFLFEEEKQAPQANPKDIKSELNMIIQSYGISPPDALLETIASLFNNPPPWSPWS